MAFPVTDAHLAAGGVDPAHRAVFLPHLNPAMIEFSITYGERPAMFLAQVIHESAGFVHLAEIWGPTRAQLRYDDGGSLARALGNGPDEGFAWRGHGLIQITGYYNHKAEAEHFGIPVGDIAAWLQTPAGACRSAGHFWSRHGCNALADAFALVDLTRVINGGYNGLQQRTDLYRAISSEMTK